MNVIIEIGYTNIKVLINGKISLYKATSINIGRLIEKYKSEASQIYICSNNEKLNPEINQHKLNNIDKITIVDKYLILNKLNSKMNINVNEVGIDLLVLCLYLRLKRFKDCLLISVGSAIVSLVWKDFDIHSVGINLGIESVQKSINAKLGLKSSTEFRHIRGVTTETALELGNFLYLDGIIKSNRNLFELDKKPCILTGNGVNGKNFGPLKDTNENIEYQDNIILNTLDILFNQKQ